MQMMDSNQVWGVEQAIEHMKQLASFKPFWIEEPTSPDDVLGLYYTGCPRLRIKFQCLTVLWSRANGFRINYLVSA